MSVTSCPDCELAREEFEPDNSSDQDPQTGKCEHCVTKQDRNVSIRLPCCLGASYPMRFIDTVLGPLDIVLQFCYQHDQYCGEGTIFLGESSSHTWWWSSAKHQMMEPHSGMFGELPITIKDVNSLRTTALFKLTLSLSKSTRTMSIYCRSNQCPGYPWNLSIQKMGLFGSNLSSE